MADVREDLVEKHPKYSVTDVAKKLGKMWKSVTDKEKEQYISQASALKAAYTKKMEKYKASSSYKKHQKALAEWKAKAQKKPFKKDKNAPKRPLSAYMVYVNQVRDDVVADNPDMKATDVLQEIGGMWRDLDDAAKAKLEGKAKKLKSKYEMDLEAYQKTKKYKAYQAEKEAYLAERKAAAKKRAVSASPAPSAKKAKQPKRRRRRSASRSRSRRRRRAATPRAPSAASSMAASTSAAPSASSSKSRSRRRRSASKRKSRSRA